MDNIVNDIDIPNANGKQTKSKQINDYEWISVLIPYRDLPGCVERMWLYVDIFFLPVTGSAATFNGSSAAISYTTTCAPHYGPDTNQITVEAWMKAASSIDDAWRGVVAQGNYYLNFRYKQLAFCVYGNTTVQNFDNPTLNNGDYYMSNCTNLTVGVWYHIAASAVSGIDNSNEQIDSPITTVLDNDKTESRDIPHGIQEMLTSIHLQDHLEVNEIPMFDENLMLHVKDWLYDVMIQLEPPE
ncbi:unnamed protein product [Didymodactylos carnosus]|uniref:Uncharacterized protein n=1 Tax=Didymodactylos carnosus TaxID=1234261 RepID=A0A815C134_9BILA|nr:unnamed protein product [Didymodactylos carnosus]CAF1336096.1 unnamed protein product [Didymodactylos carnosus]CAF4064829.1 unnamed protein product [Didymodactylos carnosus]CAF4147355.1 unnamed protein product [Didymodactylos carnosus]